ncbi:MAG: hypothetical protein HC875_29025 [Anaerolineales bacterium]|nr:hypothetical protein [Anaerolineales bacterium]
MTILESVQSSPDLFQSGSPVAAPGKNGGYFAFDDPKVIHEVASRLEPPIHDDEVAGHIAHWLRSSDAIDGSGLENLGHSRQFMVSSDQLGEKHSYFGFKDAHATQEVLCLLGPSVADETLSGYYEHCLA